MLPAAAPPSAHDSSRWWILLAIGMGTFMSALDTSVVNVILPLIRQSLTSDVAAVEWVVTIYLLVLSGLLLSFGRLGDIRGHKRVYLSGFAIFIASSAFCGLAQSVAMLVICRAVQALGAAMLASNSPAILTKGFPPEQRGRALGLQATMTYLGLVAGPALGGWLASWAGWQAVFYINIPVGLAAAWVSIRFIPNDAPRQTSEPFDAPGSVVFMLGLSTLLLGLNQGHAWGWRSPATLALIGAAALLLTFFIRIERRSPHPMLDLNLFRSRVFSLSVASAVLNYICVYSVLFLMPFYLAEGRGLEAGQMGLVLSAQPLVMMVIAPISGTLSDRVGVRLPGVTGMGILAVGVFLLSMVGGDTRWAIVALALGIVGLGTGTFISPNNSALMGAAPKNRQGVAAGALATARNFGMVLGVGLTGAIYTTILAHGQAAASATVFEAVQWSFRAATLVAILGALTTAIREEN